MKYNKFLIALALCMGISANISFCSEGPWTPPGPSAVYNALPSTRTIYNALTYTPKAVYRGLKSAPTAAYRGLKYVAGGLGGSAIRGSSYIWNKVSSWSPTTQVSVLGALVVALLATGYYNKEELKKLFNGTVDSAPEPNQEIESSEGVGSHATVIGQPPITREQPIYSQPEPSQITQLSSTQIQTEPVKQQSKQQAQFKKFLEESNYAVDTIKQLQLAKKDDKDLEAVLLDHYYYEYINQLKSLPNKNKQAINEVIEQEKEKCILSTEAIAAHQEGPILMGSELGTNRGRSGLRMKVLNFLGDYLQEGRLKLTQ